MYQSELIRCKETVLKRHPKYPDFARFLKRTSRKKIRDTSVVSYLKQLGVMRNKFGLDLENPDIIGVIDRMIDANLNAMGINIRRTVLRRWLKFMKHDLTEEERDALKNQSGPIKRPLRKKHIITEDLLVEILSHVTDPAERAYFAVLWDLGLRPSEGTNLNVEQVIQDEYGFKFLLDADENKLKNTWGKRILYMIEPIAIMHFQAWWAMHPRRQKPDAPLFITCSGIRVDPQVAGQLLRRIRDKMGLDTLYPYLFRKSMATRWISCGRDERLLRYRMGHARDSKTIEKSYLAMGQDDFANGQLALLGIKKEKDEPVQDTINCPHCGQVNRVREAACFRCGTALTAEEGVRRLKMAATGAIFEDVLGSAFDDMFSEYMEEHGERIAELLQPIVTRMIAASSKKQSRA